MTRWIAGRSGQEAARLLSVSPSTVHYWLSGESLPPDTRIPLVASVLGVGEAKLRQVVERDRANRGHGRDDANSPADANVPHGVRS